MADRNPSPPRLSAEEIELIQYDNIGETVFSKKWVLSTLMKLVQVVQTSTEGSEDEPDEERQQQREDEDPHELDDAFERELCELWDMSMNAVSSRKEIFFRLCELSKNLCMWYWLPVFLRECVTCDKSLRGRVRRSDLGALFRVDNFIQKIIRYPANKIYLVGVILFARYKGFSSLNNWDQKLWVTEVL